MSYREGYRDGLGAAWKAVDALIKRGDLPTTWATEQRNGMVLACNAIMQVIRMEDSLRPPDTREASK